MRGGDCPPPLLGDLLKFRWPPNAAAFLLPDFSLLLAAKWQVSQEGGNVLQTHVLFARSTKDRDRELPARQKAIPRNFSLAQQQLRGCRYIETSRMALRQESGQNLTVAFHT